MAGYTLCAPATFPTIAFAQTLDLSPASRACVPLKATSTQLFHFLHRTDLHAEFSSCIISFLRQRH
ncbi:hypothetical protein AX27061_4972 [Achromobacter xylosoxidans NBRC 15126 = ATCC 27061]|nr:hypothetical protein AX27061_4972 [Achromobacter xylosoxidans NBRC 15126 = ATCC 27061]